MEVGVYDTPTKGEPERVPLGIGNGNTSSIVDSGQAHYVKSIYINLIPVHKIESRTKPKRVWGLKRVSVMYGHRALFLIQPLPTDLSADSSRVTAHL